MPATTTHALAVPTIEESYRYCREVAKNRAKNFYYSFLLLDKVQRDAMCVIYAFMRHCDDLSDDPAVAGEAQARQKVALWRMQLDRALKGEVQGHLIWPAFHETVARYAIPHRYFYEMIEGILSDLQPRQTQTFDELYRYCYHVASVVGLTIIHIFGFRSSRALLLAEKCGVAFQLTNIMRDVREDAGMGRIYLPLEDLARFQVPVEQLRSGREDNRFRDLMHFEAGRARAYYDESAPLSELIEPRSRRSLWALREIYSGLLTRIESANYSVLSRRIQVPTRTKIALLLRAFLKS
jgi:15-cis-phytoene synthase